MNVTPFQAVQPQIMIAHFNTFPFHHIIETKLDLLTFRLFIKSDT